MPFQVSAVLDHLWQNALAVIPLVLIAAAATRWLPAKPATRHAVWVIVLAWMAMASLFPQPAAVVERLPEQVAKPAALLLPSVPQRRTLPKLERAAPTRRVVTPRPVVLPDKVQISPVATVPVRRPPTARRSSIDRAPQSTPRSIVSAPAFVDRVSSATPPQRRAEYPSLSDRVSAESPFADPSVSPWDRQVPGAIVDRLADLRATILELPAIPMSLWMGGIVFLAVLHIGRGIAFRRTIRQSLSAPPAVQRQVRAAAARIGLRRAPETYMVRGHISPMVWCPFMNSRSRLILPIQLWLELDAVARNAVLFHEMAHLRRRDHWVRALECLIGAVYWWNPIVWWVRSRIHEEAENCCDSWVIWLLPRGRRAYAEALLRTREYVSRSAMVVPATGMGVATRRGRKLARRITMVMTNKNTPGLSMYGMMLIAALAVAGWWMAPVMACPPKCTVAEAQDRADAPDATLTSMSRTLAPLALQATQAMLLTESAPESSYEAHMNARGGDMEDRMARLEEQMEVLMVSLQELVAARPMAVPAVPAANPFLAIPGGEETYQVDYKLPSGRLAELTELMSRQDVPTLISPGDDHITVHANARDHAIFRAFVDMIYPEGAQKDAHPLGAIPTMSQVFAVTRRDADLAREEAVVAEYQQRESAYEHNLKGLIEAREDLTHRRRDFYGRMRELALEAKRLEAESEITSHEAEWAERMSEESDGNERRVNLKRAEDLARRAIELEHRAREVEHQAEEMEVHMEELEHQLHEIEHRTEELQQHRRER
jgi:beta-lactamase regulating signal transducer with metallopeptidase domain